MTTLLAGMIGIIGTAVGLVANYLVGGNLIFHYGSQTSVDLKRETSIELDTKS